MFNSKDKFYSLEIPNLTIMINVTDGVNNVRVCYCKEAHIRLSVKYRLVFFFNNPKQVDFCPPYPKLDDPLLNGSTDPQREINRPS